MNKEFNNKLKGIFIVSISLFLVLIPFSMVIGWNFFTAILFWLVLTPALAIYLPTAILKKKDHLMDSLIGMVIFYAFMVFMTYDHYKTDYFKLMIVSLMINMMVVSWISWAIRQRKLIHTDSLL